jgi:hypothetical protein
VPDGGESGAGEKYEPLAIVEIIALVRAVIVTAVKIFSALDEIDGQTVIVRHIDVRGGVAPGVAHGAVLVDQMHGIVPCGKPSVERRDDGHAHAQA